MPIDRTACPEFLNDYILYLSMSKSLSPRTVEEYYLDIRLFLQYILMMKDKQYVKLDETDMQKISIVDFPVSLLDTIKLQDLYEFLYYVTNPVTTMTVLVDAKFLRSKAYSTIFMSIKN